MNFDKSLLFHFMKLPFMALKFIYVYFIHIRIYFMIRSLNIFKEKKKQKCEISKILIIFTILFSAEH